MVSSYVSERDYVILGAGPAGLQLGYFLDRAGRDYEILEAAPRAGSFFDTYPRHRKLLSINKIYTGYDDREINLRWDWNSLLGDDEAPRLADFSDDYFPDAAALTAYLQRYAEHHGLRIRYRTPVSRVSRDADGRFRLRAGDGVFLARRLVVATGTSRPYVPDVPGIEDVEAYEDVSVDRADFRGQRVLVLGKGNSAFETADNLVPTASLIHLASPSSIRMAWQTHFVGHLRAVNNNLLDTYQLKSQNALLDAGVERITQRPDGTFGVLFRYAHANGEREELVYDRVIRCTGFRFDASIFDDDVQPELTLKDRFPRQTGEWESTNVPDLYFGGTLMQARDYKKTTSAFIHGFRYNMRCLFRICNEKYHDEPWPRRRLAGDPETLTHAMLQRINASSALWQQFGYLADMVQVDDDGGAYFEEVPVDHVHEGPYGEHPDYYLVTLEYGPDHQHDNPFAVERVARNEVDRAERSNFLHPVVRRYRGRVLLSEHHVIEDLLAEWKEREHIDPLQRFLEAERTAAGAPAPMSV